MDLIRATAAYNTDVSLCSEREGNTEHDLKIEIQPEACPALESYAHITFGISWKLSVWAPGRMRELEELRKKGGEKVGKKTSFLLGSTGLRGR